MNRDDKYDPERHARLLEHEREIVFSINQLQVDLQTVRQRIRKQQRLLENRKVETEAGAPSKWAVKVGEKYYRRRYNSWDGNRGTLEDCTTYRTFEGAEKRAEQLREYLAKTNQRDLAKTVETVPVA